MWSSGTVEPDARIPRRRDQPASNLAAEAVPGAVEVSAAAVVLLITLLVGVGWQGAYHRGGQVALGLGLALAAGVSAGASRLERGEWRWPPPVAVAALGSWMALASLAHATPERGVGPLALAVGVAATLVVARRLGPSDRMLLLEALPVIGALAAVVGWLGLVLRHPTWSQEAQGLWRAAGTLTYSNALAATLVPLALVAIADTVPPPATASPARSRLVPVPLTRSLATVMVAGVLATLSRGGAMALAVGLALLAASGGWSMVRVSAGPLLGAAVVFAGLVPSLSTDATRHPLIAVAGLAAGLTVTHLIARLVEHGGPTAGVTARRRAAVAAVLCTVVAVMAVVVGSRVQAIVEVRLGSGSNYRAQAADAALSLLADNPVLGTGPGGAVVNWQDTSGADVTLRYLHNEYLQVLVEAGIVGGSLLLAVVVAGIVAARHDDRSPGRPVGPTPTPRSIRAGGLAALGAFAVSSAVDIVWHLPALPVLMATVFALTLTSSRPSSAGHDSLGAHRAGIVATSLATKRQEEQLR